MVPYTSALILTSGSMLRGIPNASRSTGSQSHRLMSYRSVRLAFETSVTWTAPAVRFQMTHVSGEPNSRSPRSAFSRAPGTLSRIQRIFGASK